MKDPRLMSTEELKELKELTQTLLAEREDEKRRFEQQSKRRTSKGVRIRLERVRCGQKRCRKCSGEGLGHGPYWYAYFPRSRQDEEPLPPGQDAARVVQAAAARRGGLSGRR
jgi:hypothetical protein